MHAGACNISQDARKKLAIKANDNGAACIHLLQHRDDPLAVVAVGFYGELAGVSGFAQHVYFYVVAQPIRLAALVGDTLIAQLNKLGIYCRGEAALQVALLLLKPLLISADQCLGDGGTCRLGANPLAD